MPAAAKRAVDVNAMRAVARQVERIDRFSKRHRAMLKLRHRKQCHYGALEKNGKYIGSAGIDRLLFLFGQFRTATVLVSSRPIIAVPVFSLLRQRKIVKVACSTGVFQHNRPIEDHQNGAVYEAVAGKQVGGM